MLRRTSSLLSTAVTRQDWLSDVTTVDSNGATVSSSPLSLSLWTLECEVFVRDVCVGLSRRMRDYGLATVRCEGFRSSNMQSRTMLVVVETESDESSISVLGGSGSQNRSSRFEAFLVVWSLERPHHVDRVSLHWSGDYMRRLLGVHKLACASSPHSDAERISLAGAHELTKSLSRPLPFSLRRVPINNYPLFSKRSRQLLLNPVFPIALVL